LNVISSLPNREDIMHIHLRYRFPLLSVALLAVTISPPARAGQLTAPPINGVTGTIALSGNVDKLYAGLNTILVKTSDSLDHVVHLPKGTTVHGGAASLDSLRPGTPVVVHYTVKGIQSSPDEIDRLGPGGLKQTEGTVIGVDRGARRITIRFATGETQALRLTHHAAADAEGHARSGSRVVVYYSDESGHRVAHYFKPAH
jgi:hypothetical protein